MSELLHVFIGESRENLESASQDLLNLHSNGFSQEAIDNVFRDLHTIKGSSDLFDIKPLTALAHAAEDLLDSLRGQHTRLEPDICDLLLESLDQISSWFDELEEGSEEVENWLPVSQEMAARLRGCIGNQQITAEAPSAVDVDNTPARFADESVLIEFERSQRLSVIAAAINGGKELTIIRYSPDEDCFFRGEDPLNVALNSPERIAFKCEPCAKQLNDVFQCALSLTVASLADEQALQNHYAYYEEQHQRYTFGDEQLLAIFRVLSQKTVSQLEDGEIDRALSQGDFDRCGKMAELALLTAEPSSEALACLQVICAVCKTPELQALWSVEKEPVCNPPNQNSDAEQKVVSPSHDASQRRDLLTQQLTMLQAIGDSEDSPLLPAIKTVIQRVTHKQGPQESNSAADWLNWLQDFLSTEDVIVEPETPAPVIQSPGVSDEPTVADKERISAEPQIQKQERQIPKTLKVNQEKIDYLMDLVGELTVAKNSLPYLAKQAEESDDKRRLSKQIKSHFSIVNRLTEELQSAVLQIRMVPVSHVFQRYPRLVRDLARKLSKKIDLVVEGEETEFDKNLIESLSEPLIHLLRNSIDHGIESPEIRQSQGKSETGTIHLSAMPQDDNVIIEIRDDGKGIDAEKIKMLAYQKGVIQEHQLESLSEEDALQLIFAPGFSTSEQVSDLSGRGVGMDAVRTMVMQAGGSIEMHSKVGEGSCFRLILPQTMSVNRIMMFEVNDQMFGLGLDSVVETVKVSRNDIELIRNRPVLILRNKIIPLHCLRDLLRLPAADANNEEICVLVVNGGQGDFGLIIDKFHEGIDVIQKPLEGVMAGFTHFSGTALLGDGRVLLIINIQELVACQ